MMPDTEGSELHRCGYSSGMTDLKRRTARILRHLAQVLDPQPVIASNSLGGYTISVPAGSGFVPLAHITAGMVSDRRRPHPH
jgi:hypothetical protein